MTPNALTIFITGITGVIAGMAVLYLAVKLTSLVTDKWLQATAGKE